MTAPRGPAPTRLAPVRRRLVVARRALVVAAVGGFAVTALIARASHLGTTDAGASSDTSSGSSDALDAFTPDDGTGTSDFGSGSISPGGAGQPRVTTGVS